MSIKMIWEKRHHLNKEDICYPAVFCDVCCERILEAKEANYCWTSDILKFENIYSEKFDFIFVHKKCSMAITNASRSRGRFNLITESGMKIDSDLVVHSMWEDLTSFPIHMGRNLNMRINAQHRDGGTFDPEFGKLIDEQTYPVCSNKKPNGWIYFIVEAGGIEKKVKIGFSKKVYSRLKNMQTGCPSELKCYGAVPGLPEDEEKAHAFLEHCRSHGEWFFFYEARDVIDDWIGMNKIIEPVWD